MANAHSPPLTYRLHRERSGSTGREMNEELLHCNQTTAFPLHQIISTLVASPWCLSPKYSSVIRGVS